MIRVRRTAAPFVVALAVAGALVPARGAVTLGATIQPGARITRPDIEPFENRLPYKFYRCSLAFIFRDARRHLFTGTTGEKECVPRRGARVYDADGRAFGTAMFQENKSAEQSFTLIRIDRARYRDVSASVLGWGGPTGVASLADTTRGATVLFTGQGFVEGDIAQTRPRPGVLLSYDRDRFTADTLAELGDSGGPLIDAATGRAIGMISGFGLSRQPPTTDLGPSILRILSDCARYGYHLTVVRAPFVSPLP